MLCGSSTFREWWDSSLPTVSDRVHVQGLPVHLRVAHADKWPECSQHPIQVLVPPADHCLESLHASAETWWDESQAQLPVWVTLHAVASKSCSAHWHWAHLLRQSILHEHLLLRTTSWLYCPAGQQSLLHSPVQHNFLDHVSIWVSSSVCNTDVTAAGNVSSLCLFCWLVKPQHGFLQGISGCPTPCPGYS